ncbi:DUF378 domain-containing protein [Candidatus Kaiserbacteria bacterium]|nr:DUF378 domain-containing protein [Candidatus Kaiserbacteria bacterium]
MKALHMVGFILLVVGGLNWGLVGLATLVGNGANWNVVNLIAGYIGGAQTEAVIYVLVGLSAVWMLVGHKKDCRTCSM